MDGTVLLSLPEGMRVEDIQLTKQGFVIEVVATQPASCCPLCAQSSDSIKTHYRRVLRDAPCTGHQVQLLLTVRKFYCRNPYCPRKVFTERLPTFVEPWARMTTRCSQHVTALGLATSGKAGARLADRLGIPTTRPTILRRIMDLPEVSTGSVVYLGIDDFSFRRGYRFGTILVDLESHRVVDLLPDRQQETAARWMRQQPDLAVISRDRGGEYASAAREGHRLDAWLTRVAESGLPELQSFAAGVEKDKDAVKAGLTWAVNNGLVEGHVTKLKLIKRTMYGRAGFALLRQRVLHAV